MSDRCWITSGYPKEQVYLEYFFVRAVPAWILCNSAHSFVSHSFQEFFSAGLSFILYSIVILRVRGNIIQSDGNWCLRVVPRGQSWQLSFGRDLIDSAMLKVAQNMVWYPVRLIHNRDHSVKLISISRLHTQYYSFQSLSLVCLTLEDMTYLLDLPFLPTLFST